MFYSLDGRYLSQTRRSHSRVYYSTIWSLSWRITFLYVLNWDLNHRYGTILRWKCSVFQRPNYFTTLSKRLSCLLLGLTSVMRESYTIVGGPIMYITQFSITYRNNGYFSYVPSPWFVTFLFTSMSRREGHSVKPETLQRSGPLYLLSTWGWRWLMKPEEHKYLVFGCSLSERIVTVDWH